MSQISAGQVKAQSYESHFGALDLSERNTRLPQGWGGGLMIGLIALGLACIGATVAYGFMGGDHAHAAGDAAHHGPSHAKHAWLSYHAGAIVAIGIMLGSLGLVLITRCVQAGWNVTIRRTSEAVASLLPLCLLLILPMMIGGHHLWHWMDPNLIDPVLEKKRSYLNQPFFWGRMFVYVAVWAAIGLRMYSLSRRQDVTGDIGLTNTAQRDSAWGLLLYALTTAFAGFDLIMSLDHHWFSTMFGVYFFAGNILSGVAITVLILAVLRRAGVLQGLVTAEHFHDLGKLMVAFTVFWAYIGFSQYFLIWYANIPEETAWMLARGHGGWENVAKVMMFGHFVLPFVILLFRRVKKSTALLAFFAVWQLVMHAVDVFWMIRPGLNIGYGTDPVAATQFTFAWVDITGLLGPTLLLMGLVVWRLRSAPLIALKDPRLAEALNHKNYV